MARIADTERLERLLNESNGGSLSRREIIESLGFSDERYAEIAKKLIDKHVVERNLGRLGGLRLRPESPSAPSKQSAAAASRSGDGGEIRDKPAEPAEKELEKDLYPPFAKYLRDAAAKNDESKSIILHTYKTKQRKWETPDLVEVRATPFPMVGQWELRIVTYELKRRNAWSVDSVLQTASYDDFAHESWLVVPTGDGDWEDHFGKRTVDKAGTFGIGLATFDPAQHIFKKHMTPQRKQHPSLSRLQEWLESTLERLNETTGKQEIGANIRWAQSKAEAGRD